MAEPKDRSPILVNTAEVLEKVHAALTAGREARDPELVASAESVLSALVLVLRHKTAELPAAVRAHLERIER